MNFSTTKPTKKTTGWYCCRTIGWRAADIKKQVPGFWKYYYTYVNVFLDDEDDKIYMYIIGYEKPISVDSDTINQWEWAKIELPKDIPTRQNPKPCWESDIK